MRLHKSTRYALCAALELAAAGPDEPITASAVAERHDVPPTVMAKVFQQLVRRRIAVGARGAGGGYRLARPAARTTVLDVIDAVEPSRRDESDIGDPRLRALFDEVDELARTTFASVSLETLLGARSSML